MKPGWLIGSVALTLISSAASLAQEPGNREAFVRRFDADGDGKLSASEIEKARAAGGRAGRGQRKSAGAGVREGGQAAGPEVRNNERIEGLIRRFDANGNGTLDYAEMAACREALRAPHVAGPPPAEKGKVSP